MLDANKDIDVVTFRGSKQKLNTDVVVITFHGSKQKLNTDVVVITFHGSKQKLNTDVVVITFRGSKQKLNTHENIQVRVILKILASFENKKTPHVGMCRKGHSGMYFSQFECTSQS